VIEDAAVLADDMAAAEVQRLIERGIAQEATPASRAARWQIHGVYCVMAGGGSAMGMATRRQISMVGAPFTRMLCFST